MITDDVDVWSYDTCSWVSQIATYDFALDGRPVLLRIPGVNNLPNFSQHVKEQMPVGSHRVLKRSWKAAMDSLDHDLLKRPSTFRPSRRVRARVSSPDGPFALPSSDIESGSDDSFEKSFKDFVLPFAHNSTLSPSSSHSRLTKPLPTKHSLAQSMPSKPSISLPVAEVGDSELDRKRVALYAQNQVYTGEATSTSWPQGMSVKDMVHAFRFVCSVYWVEKVSNKSDRISMVLGGLQVPVRQFRKQEDAWKHMTVEEWADANGPSGNVDWTVWWKDTQGWRHELDRNNKDKKEKKIHHNS